MTYMNNLYFKFEKSLRNSFLFCGALVLLLASCSKDSPGPKDDDGTPPPTGNLSANLYVVGTETESDNSMKIKYWLNGKDQNINPGTTNETRATTVFVSGSDVYIGGMENDGGNWVARIWKNGSKSNLDGRWSRVFSILVDGNDVYTVGSAGIGNPTPVLWKNSSVVNLVENGNTSVIGGARWIFKYNGEIYIVASGWKGNKVRLMIWKYKQLGTLSMDQEMEVPMDEIGDVYMTHDGNYIIVGDEKDGSGSHPVLWDTKTKKTLSPSGLGSGVSTTIAYLNSVFVENGKIYVAGDGSKTSGGGTVGIIWKNGTPSRISNKSNLTETLNSLIVLDSHTLVAGGIVPAGGKNSPVLWVDSDEQILPHNGVIATASDVFAVKK